MIEEMMSPFPAPCFLGSTGC